MILYRETLVSTTAKGQKYIKTQSMISVILGLDWLGKIWFGDIQNVGLQVLGRFHHLGFGHILGWIEYPSLDGVSGWTLRKDLGSKMLAFKS